MKLCRVKVIKAGLKSYWYAKNIGEEFTAQQLYNTNNCMNYLLVQEGTFDYTPTASYFDGNDIEVMETFDGIVKQQVTITVERTS